MDKTQTIFDVPLIDQTTYAGYIPEAGGYLCSAACLTMVLQHFLGPGRAGYNEIANQLIDEGYLDRRGLLSGDYLERFICHHLDQYTLIANYSEKQFEAGYLTRTIKQGKLIIASVPHHYTLITGYQVGGAGVIKFRMNDPFREHWQPDSQNAVLSNEWVSEKELQNLWEGRHTVFSPDFMRISKVVCFFKKVIRKVQR